MKNEVKIQLRLPTGLRDWFAGYSANLNRSMNGQMIVLLQERMLEVAGAGNGATNEKTLNEAGKQ